MAELLALPLLIEIDTDLALRINRLREFDIIPRLEIVNDNVDYQPSVIYSHIKVETARRLGMIANVTENPNTDAIVEKIHECNEDDAVHGIIVQAPSVDPTRTERLFRLVNRIKDVDGLNPNALHIPATPMAVKRLTAHYGIDLFEERVAQLGYGRVFGGPMHNWAHWGGAVNYRTFDEYDDPLTIVSGLDEANVIIAAMNLPEVLTPALFEDMGPKTLVDVGAAELGGKVVGNASEELREFALANGWSITPKKGGVGPVTVRQLLENTVTNAEAIAFGTSTG